MAQLMVLEEDALGFSSLVTSVATLVAVVGSVVRAVVLLDNPTSINSINSVVRMEMDMAHLAHLSSRERHPRRNHSS